MAGPMLNIPIAAEPQVPEVSKPFINPPLFSIAFAQIPLSLCPLFLASSTPSVVVFIEILSTQSLSSIHPSPHRMLEEGPGNRQEGSGEESGRVLRMLINGSCLIFLVKKKFIFTLCFGAK